jgi:nitroreductase
MLPFTRGPPRLTQSRASEDAMPSESHGPDLFEIIRATRSMRRLKPDPVPDDLIRKILEAGVCAPSGGNMQRWRFLVIRDPNVKQRRSEPCTSAPGMNRWPHGIGLANPPLAPAGSGLRGCLRRRNISPITSKRPRCGSSPASKARRRPAPPGRRFTQPFRTCYWRHERSASERL